MVTKCRHHLTLKRSLGLTEATFAGVGIILGAGIYALIGQAAGIAGNSVWLSFLIGAFVAAFTGFSYAELSSMFPRDASEYLYAEKAFSEHIGFLIAFLVIFEGVVSAAAVALGFGGYLAGLLQPYIAIPIFALAILCISIYSVINYHGIKETAWLNVVFTLLEAGGLIFIVALGLSYFGKVNLIEMPHGYTGVFSAAALIFFAYIGFEAIVKLSEETKNARKIIPRALVLSIAISTIIYVLVAIASVSILGWETLASSAAPLADVAAAVLGNKAFLILAIIALFSTSNTVLMILVTTSRLLYGIAQKYKRIKILSAIHKKRRTPWIAIIFTMIIAMMFAMIGDIKIVAEVTNFAIFATFIIINASLIALRYKQPKAKRVFRVPGNIGKFPIIPLLGVITCLFLIAHLSWYVVLAGFGLMAVGYGTYFALKSSSQKHVIIKHI